MIFDSMSNLGRYRGLSPGIDRAIAYLETADLSALPPGRTELDSNLVYLNHMTYTTAQFQSEDEFEAHMRYLDLHVILAGQEYMAVTPISSLGEVGYKEDEDSVMYHGVPAYELPMEANHFVLLYPGEGHLPRLTRTTPVEVNKLVFKIAI